jgi:hypothetical protein
MSNIIVDRERVLLPTLTADGSDLPAELRPLTDHLTTIRTALDGLNVEVAKINRNEMLSASGRSEKLTAAGQAALDVVSAQFDPPIKLIGDRAQEALATAMRKATAGLDATRVTILGERIGGLEKSARLRIIGAALKAGDVESLGTLYQAPEGLGVFDGLDEKLRDHVRDVLLDASAPKARKDFERIEFALGRSKVAREVLQRKVQEVAGIAPPRNRTLLHTNAGG